MHESFSDRRKNTEDECFPRQSNKFRFYLPYLKKKNIQLEMNMNELQNIKVKYEIDKKHIAKTHATRIS